MNNKLLIFIVLFPQVIFAFPVQNKLVLQVSGSDIIVIAKINKNVGKKVLTTDETIQKKNIYIECTTESVLKGNIEDKFFFNYIEIEDNATPFKNNESYLLFLHKKDKILSLKYKNKSQSSYDLSNYCKAMFKVTSYSDGKPKDKIIYVSPDFLLKRVIYIHNCNEDKKEIKGLPLSILDEPILGQQPNSKGSYSLESLVQKASDAFKKKDLRTSKAYCIDALAISPYSKTANELLKKIITKEIKIVSK